MINLPRDSRADFLIHDSLAPPESPDDWVMYQTLRICRPK
jgi:hypothetical protein